MNQVKEIMRQATQIELTDSGFLFLYYLDEYLKILKDDAFLSKALLLMKECHKQESEDLAHKADDINTDLYSIQSDIQLAIDEKYPHYHSRKTLLFNC